MLSTEPLPELGPFRPIRALGEGKTGQVYLVELPKDAGVAAAKVLRPEIAGDLASVKDYLGVANKLVKLRHIGLARMYDARKLGDGRIVVVTEYIDGLDLGSYISERGALDPDRVAQLAHQLASALAAAHEGGVIHLDLKPSDVFLTQDGAGKPLTKLTDFGMAQLRSRQPSPRQDPYRSPEQRDGKAGDARSDLYSLGAVLYEALAGRKPRRTGPGLPFARPERGTMIPLRLEALVLKCLAEDPEERPETAAALAGALEPLLPAPAPPPMQVVEAQITEAEPANTPSSPGSFSAVTKQQETEIARICPTCNGRFPPEIEYCSTDGTRLPAPAVVTVSEEEPEGPKVVGSYRLLRLIGEGGMGRVYLAEHTLLGRRVALKMLLPEFSRDASSVSRFFHEARVVNQIGHENIVDITDFVENVGGDNYYVMEYLDGNSLKATMDDAGPFPPERVVRVGTQIADALAAAHRAGAIHRDLKPDNIFLLDKKDRSDFVKLLDFGIAKLINADGMSLQTTIEGAVLGTPEYMSPEQASGETVDERTDVYSLGVILYAMATGQLPITAPNYAQLLIKLIGTEPRKPADLDEPIALPPALEALIMRCLSKDPDGRFGTMEQLTEALERCLDGVAASAAEATAVGAPAIGTEAAAEDEVETEIFASPGAPRRSRLVPALGIGAAVAVALVVGALLLFGNDDEPAPPVPPAPDRAAADAPAKKPAPPARVSVAFASEPEGARVFQGGSKKPLGTTPFMSSLPPSKSALDFTFKLDGHRTVTKKAAIAEGAEIHASLSPVAPAAAAKKTKTKTKKTSTRRGKGKKKRKKEPRRDKKQDLEKNGPRDEDETLDPFAS